MRGDADKIQRCVSSYDERLMKKYRFSAGVLRSSKGEPVSIDTFEETLDGFSESTRLTRP